MCPPLSCCHGRSTSSLSAPLYSLLRLLLASATPHELTSIEQAALPARLAACCEALQAAVQHHYRIGPARAWELMEQLVASLLLDKCCRQSLRRAVPLAEALAASEYDRELTSWFL